MLLKVVERPDLDKMGVIGLQQWHDGALVYEFLLPVQDRVRVASFLRDWAAQVVKFFAPKLPSVELVKAAPDGPQIYCCDPYTRSITSLPVSGNHGKWSAVGTLRTWLTDGSSVESFTGPVGPADVVCEEKPSMQNEARESMRGELVKELRRLEEEAGLAEIAERDAKAAHVEAKARVKFMLDLIARLCPGTWTTTT